MKKYIPFKIFSVVIAAVMLLTACSAMKTEEIAATTEPAEQAAEVAVTETTAADNQQQSVYEIKDGDNTLKIAPIYSLDGKNIFAAYIISVKDKAGKELNAQSYPLLMSVVSVSGNSSGVKLNKNNSSLIKIDSYSDDKGELVAIQDVSDANKNNNKTEFLKLVKVDGANGTRHYKLTKEIVIIEKDSKNKKYAVINGKKVTLTEVDSKNTKVKDNINSDTQNNKKPENKTEATSSTTSPDNKTSSYAQIVLKKNGAAASSAPGVSSDTNEVVISKGGDYLVTSDTSTWHGVIKIMLSNKEKAEVRFENVDISYNKGSIIQIIDTSDSMKRDFLETEVSSESVVDDDLNDAMDDLADRESAPDVSLTFPTGTTSSFECSSNVYSGVIYNESKLEIKGNGKVNITATANANNVLCTSKSVTFKNVTAHLKSAAFGVTDSIGGSRGIFSYGKVNIESGSVDIDSNGDCIRCDRLSQTGGTLNATSSAADGIDAEDSIDITGGKSTVTALKKSSFKVRRVNNQERYDNGERIPVKDCVRSGKNDRFKIDGGTVKGESKKITDPLSSSNQKSIVCRTVKKVKGSKTEAKESVKWKVDSVASSSNPCVKFLYSSSSVSKNDYSVKVNNTSKDTTWTWNGNYGACYVVSSTSK